MLLFELSPDRRRRMSDDLLALIGRKLHGLHRDGLDQPDGEPLPLLVIYATS
jgi:hypothetical protein